MARYAVKLRGTFLTTGLEPLEVFEAFLPSASGPCNAAGSYESRLRRLFPGRFKNVPLMGLDRYDLAISKLAQNTPVDRDDVKYLCKAIPLDPNVLRTRYETELRPNLGNPNRDDLTLKLWLEAFFPDEARQS